MAGCGGTGGCFGGSWQEKTHQRNVISSQNHDSYQSSVTSPQDLYVWGFQTHPTQNPNLPNGIFYTSSPPQPQNHLLQNLTLPSPTTQNHMADMRYNHLNSPRAGSGSGSTQYGMMPLNTNTNPTFDVQSLETGLSRLHLSIPSSLPDHLCGTSSDFGFSYPSYYYNNNNSINNNNVLDNGFQPVPYTIENQVDHDWQSGFERLRIDSPASRQSGVHASNRVVPSLPNGGLEDLRLRRENSNQYRYGSRRYSYPELNSTPARTCPSCLINSNISSRPGRNHLSSDDLTRGHPSRSRLELGSQRSVERSFNSCGLNSSVSFSSLYENHIPTRLRSHKAYSLEELQGQVCSVARDPQARNFLEEKVLERDQAYIELIFSEVKNELCELIVDHSANHLMQKLVGVLNEDQMSKFIIIITYSDRRLLGICDDSYGTYVMQRLLEVPLTRVQKSILVSAFKNVAGVMSKTQHGHHVIMHCLRRFSNEITVDLVEEIVKYCVELATNKSGCCVLQHCLEHVDDGEQKRRLITEIVANTLILSGDAFGNYVVQNVLDNVPQVINDVVVQLTGNYFVLSMSRFGSNVVEKCLKIADEKQSVAIMLEILSHPDILDLVKDNYGNYVIQSIWKLSQGQPIIRDTLFNLIKTNNLFLGSHMYGRRVVAAIKGSRR